MAKWNDCGSRLVFEHPLLSLEGVERARSKGRARDFLVLHSPPWVNVVAVTPQARMVLIRQWRQGTRQETLEIPGGLVDPGETPLEAGARELLEETGYQAAEMLPLGWVHPNPALFDNRCYTFLAREAVPVAGQNLEETEDIEVLLRPLQDLPGMVAQGEISHSLVISALTLFWLKYGLAALGRDDEA